MCAPPRRPPTNTRTQGVDSLTLRRPSSGTHQHAHPGGRAPTPGPTPVRLRSDSGLAEVDQPGPDPAQGRTPRLTGHTPRPRTPRPPSTGHASPDRSCNSRPGFRCHIDGRQSHDRSTKRRAGRPAESSANRPARRTTSPELEVPQVPISRCHFSRSRGVTCPELAVPLVPISRCHFPRSRGAISPDLAVGGAGHRALPLQPPDTSGPGLVAPGDGDSRRAEADRSRTTPAAPVGAAGVVRSGRAGRAGLRPSRRPSGCRGPWWWPWWP